MKVLEERVPKGPKPRESKTYRCHCGKCNSYLEYTTEDLVLGGESGCWMIYCPVCRRGIFQNFIQRWWNRERPRMPGPYLP